jgi:hypothetical protein
MVSEWEREVIILNSGLLVLALIGGSGMSAFTPLLWDKRTFGWITQAAAL